MTCKCCSGYGYVPDTDTPFPSPDELASGGIKPCPVCCREEVTMNIEQLKFKKYPVLDQGFICLVDAMGDDSSIVQAARVSYDKDVLEQAEKEPCQRCNNTGYVFTDKNGCEWPEDAVGVEPAGGGSTGFCPECHDKIKTFPSKDRALIRYLMYHQHTTPFEMVEIKFMVQVPMDCWRQWVRHRTANINEYSTRYTEAIDACQTTAPDQWRLQATDNKQGSSGFLPPFIVDGEGSDGESLTSREREFHALSRAIYQERLHNGVAKEQARKDLPLSTYTRAYWKCDLHNIFNFLRLRMDSHAQYEIRMYANAMYEIVKQIVPVACEAFEDYVLNAKKFSAMEMEIIKAYFRDERNRGINFLLEDNGMTVREREEFKKKVGIA